MRSRITSHRKPRARLGAGPAYEISPSPSQPLSKKTLTLSVAGRGWPRTPARAHAIRADLATSASLMSATTSGVR